MAIYLDLNGKEYCVNKRDNFCGVAHGQPIGKHNSFHAIHNNYRFYERIKKVNGCFYKEDFLDWILDVGIFLL